MEKILLIGENTPFLESIAGEFNNLGFTAFTAGEEDKALEIIVQETPDVIVLPMGIKRFNPLKLVFKLREVNLLSKLVYLHPEDVIPNPPDKSFFLFVPDSLSPDLIVTKIIESIDSTQPMGEMTIREVLWLLKLENKTAMIRVFTDEAQGEIFVVDGNPIACKFGLDMGDEAFESLIKHESIAYEIIWDVPEDIERNIVKDYDEIFELHVKKPESEESKPEEGIEDLSKELEVEIQELGIEKSDEEISIDEFPSLEEESWDLGENTLKEFEKEGTDISEIFKEERREAEQPPIEFGDILEGEKEEEEKSDLELHEELKVSEEELKEFPPLEEGMEFPSIESEEKKSEEEFPTFESREGSEFQLTEEESELSFPEGKEGIISGDIEFGKEPLEEEGELPEEAEKEKEIESWTEETTLKESVSGFFGQELKEEPVIPEDTESSEFEVPEEFTKTWEEAKVGEEEKPEILIHQERAEDFEVLPDESLKSVLETMVKGERGLVKIGIIKGNSIIAGIPDYTLDEKIKKFITDDYDEGYKKSGSNVIVSLKEGDYLIWTMWSNVPVGYALFKTKMIFRKVQG